MISDYLAEKVEKRLNMTKKVVYSKNLITISKTIGKKLEKIGNLIGKVAKNKGVIDVLDTMGNLNSTPCHYIGVGVNTNKNVTNKIPFLGNIRHILDFSLNSVN
jgi:hypothetical protein